MVSRKKADGDMTYLRILLIVILTLLHIEDTASCVGREDNIPTPENNQELLDETRELLRELES
jgi:hypothetical protein